jgi:RNA polymerase sigma-70 factor, ECF subfamily
MDTAKALPRLPEVRHDPAMPAKGASPAEVERFRALVDAHYAFIWRSLRRLGVAESAVDDAAQHVFWVTSRKLQDLAEGSERTFLFRTAMGVAANERRSARLRDREVADAAAVERTTDGNPTPEELLGWKQARRALDEVMDAMGSDQRTVFVLSELEGMTAPEIADMLEIPVGTAASRLRRAREEFQRGVARCRAKDSFRGAP